MAHPHPGWPAVIYMQMCIDAALQQVAAAEREIMVMPSPDERWRWIRLECSRAADKLARALRALEEA